MDYKTIYYPESRFGGFSDIDGTIAFYLRVNALIQPASIVLDIGCGRGGQEEDPYPVRRNLRILKGKCRRVIGIDVDTIAPTQNQSLDEFRPITGSRFPVPDESVDVAVVDNVLEHVEAPETFFAECRRAIRRGGYVCIRTPNVLSYFGLISRLIPERFHAAVAEKVQEGRREADVFPKYYRCNTRRELRRMLGKCGFDHYVYGYEAEPTYLMFSRLAFLFGVLHQRLSPNVFRVALFAFGRKK